MDVRYEAPRARNTVLKDLEPGDTFIHASIDSAMRGNVWIVTDHFEEDSIACVNLAGGKFQWIPRDREVIKVKPEAQVVFVRG